METVVKRFHEKRNDTGVLTFLEGERDVPFAINRVYYVYDVKQGERRGFHAHKKLKQYLICVHGSCKVLLEDKNDTIIVELNEPSKGLYVEPYVWHEMFDFSDGAVLLVLASDYYDESDYIRDYNAFVQYLKETENA